MADSYEMKDMTGSLFKNENPKHEKSPPYNGKVKIEGKEYYMNGFVNESKSGKKYFGLTFTPVTKEKKDDGLEGW